MVGMPASGKSTIGRLLAAQLGLPFFDLDALIAEEEDMTINEIFELRGEEYFREAERRCLEKAIKKPPGFVLATGGGTPCFFDNMELMNRHGVTIFLNVDIGQLHQKLLIKGTHKRPLLKDKSADQLLAELTQKFEQRKASYLKSKICLNQSLSDITDRANQVIFAIKTLKEYPKG